jgi:hypothetical protein
MGGKHREGLEPKSHPQMMEGVAAEDGPVVECRPSDTGKFKPWPLLGTGNSSRKGIPSRKFYDFPTTDNPKDPIEDNNEETDNIDRIRRKFSAPLSECNVSGKRLTKPARREAASRTKDQNRKKKKEQ